MKRKPFLTAVAFATVIFMSCDSNKSTGGLPVPKDAAMVLHVNTNSLTSKLSWEELKGTTWFREMAEKENDSLTRKILENPETSGVDAKSDFIFFVKNEKRGSYGVFEGKLKDASAFENMLKQQMPNAAVQKDGSLRYLVNGEDDVVSWTDDRFFAISNTSMMNPSSMMGNRGDGNRPSGFTTDSLRNFTKQLLDLKSDNSINDDDRFEDLVKQDGDVHLWVNYEQFTASAGRGMMSMMKVSDLFNDMAGTFTLNFEN